MSKTEKQSIPSWVFIGAIALIVVVAAFFLYRLTSGPGPVNVDALPDSVKYANPYKGGPGDPSVKSGGGGGTGAAGGAPASAVDMRQQRGGPGAGAPR